MINDDIIKSEQPQLEGEGAAPEVFNSPRPLRIKSRGWWSKPLVVIGLAFGLALTMYCFDFQPVRSESTSLSAVYVPNVSDSDLLNFNSVAWDPNRPDPASLQANKLVDTTVVPLSAQYIAQPNGGSITQVSARAAFNDKTMAVLVTWHDDTQNLGDADVNTDHPSYSDAVAVEFPMEVVAGKQPFRCMGQTDARVNIWQWKAERDHTLDGGNANNEKYDPYGEFSTNGNATPVKNFLGPGIGYLIDTGSDNPMSKAKYDPQTHTWSVIFERALLTGHSDQGVQFVPPEGGGAGQIGATQIAVAVWDGANGERLSKKAVSTWVNLSFETGNTDPQGVTNVVNVGIVGLITLLAIFLAWRLLPAANKVRD
jgi:DMSO reductase family type II enzyme heme b subunit